MSDVLKQNKSLPREIRRIARRHLKKTLADVSGQSDRSRDEAVHEARKSFKKLRAILRMVEPAISAALFRRENARFRDAARPLSEVRDAKILVETFDKLAEPMAATLRAKPLAEVRAQLVARYEQTSRRVLDRRQVLKSTTGAVRGAMHGVDQWINVPNRWRSIGRGVREAYRQARSAFVEAVADPNVERLHEWRKQTKYLRYQLEMLEPICPKDQGDLVKQVTELGELLGDNHDLAVLAAVLGDNAEISSETGVVELLLALIDRRRSAQWDEAQRLGKQFFGERPKAFARRLRRYWKAWRRDPGHRVARKRRPVA